MKKLSRKTSHKSAKVDDNLKYFVAINQELKVIRSEMATKKELEQMRSEMATKMELREMQERIFRHFDVAVEKIESSLVGANKDHISLLEDGKEDHEVRITKLEVRAGLRIE